MFYYYGAKAALAAAYPEPKHRVIVEPFAGSAAYSVAALTRGSADRAILVEKDPRVVELWRRLLGMTPDEVLALPPIAAGDRTSDMLHVVVAASNSWARIKRGMTVTPRMVARWPMMQKRMAAALPHVARRLDIIEGDYTDAPDIAATWFVDPPYQPVADEAGGKPTWWGRGQGYAAGCDGASTDFVALAEWCRTRRGQTIVCEQEGADWLPFTPLAQAVDSQGKLKTEVVWLS